MNCEDGDIFSSESNLSPIQRTIDKENVNRLESLKKISKKDLINDYFILTTKSDKLTQMKSCFNRVY